LRLAASEVALRAKEVYTLTYTVEPAGTPVTWESSDSSLVRVRDGELTALAAGACRITLRAGGLAAQCAVTVTVPTLRMSVASQEVARGTFFAVAVEVSPANTPYTLSSSDETVLRQTSQGWQAVGAGSAEIVAATPEGVTSAVAMSVLVPIEKITFTLPALTMNRGERLTLNPQITPPDATHRALRYESSNQAVVTGSPEGVLVAQGAGAATVACSADGVTDWVDVTVVVPVTQVEVRLEKTLLKVGDLCKYTVTLYPADATDKSYTVTVDGGQPAGEGAFLCTAGGTVAVMVTAWNGIVGAQGATVLDLDALAREVFRLANGERVQMGLPELASSEPLTRAAAVRAKELPASFSHDRPDGRSCFTAYDEQGVRYGAAGENIAMGYVTAASVVEGWMNSPGHRANLLSWDFGRLGVGVELDAQGNVYWVQNFTD
jgi:uncharacterized protein YkwD/uncharacterized protein YjdB